MRRCLSSCIQWIQKVLSSFRTKSQRFLLLGLEGAGKSTLLFKLKGGVFASTPLSNHVHVDTLKFNNLEFVSWDLGKAHSSVTPPWTRYLKNTDAVIFVVDAADRDRIGEAADELHRLFGCRELRNAKLLVFANKQDKPDCMTTHEVSEKIHLEDTLPRMQYHVKASVIVSEEGMYEGLS